MPVEVKTETVTLTTSARVYRMEISAPVDQVPTVVTYFETISRSEDGTLYAQTPEKVSSRSVDEGKLKELLEGLVAEVEPWLQEDEEMRTKEQESLVPPQMPMKGTVGPMPEPDVNRK